METALLRRACLRSGRLLLAHSLAVLLLVSQRGRLNPRNVDSSYSTCSRDAVAPWHRHTSRAQQAHWTRG
jgi:hypothetical protein